MTSVSTISATKAAAAFLERRSHRIVEELENEAVNVVSVDDGGVLVFTKALMSADIASGFPTVDAARERPSVELAACRWLDAHPEVGEARIRFDVVSIVAMGRGRCCVRHHIDALRAD